MSEVETAVNCSQQWQNCRRICAWTTTGRTLFCHFFLKRLEYWLFYLY